jgi:hypothetical protein
MTEKSMSNNLTVGNSLIGHNVIPFTSKQLSSIREVGKIDRRNLTDAIKEFIGYVGPDGEKSSCPERAYSNLTRIIYAPFGLNKKQREAIENGELPRDAFDEAELTFVQTLERAVTKIILNGMLNKLNRSEIKKNYKLFVKQFAELYDGLKGAA